MKILNTYLVTKEVYKLSDHYSPLEIIELLTISPRNEKSIKDDQSCKLKINSLISLQSTCNKQIICNYYRF